MQNSKKHAEFKIVNSTTTTVRYTSIDNMDVGTHANESENCFRTTVKAGQALCR